MALAIVSDPVVFNDWYRRIVTVPVLNTSTSPIWTVQVPAAVSVEDYKCYFTDLVDACEQGKRYALVLDFRDFKPGSVDSKIRLEVAKFVNANIKGLEQVFVCEARIVTNPMVRAMMTLFDAIAPLPWPTRNVASVEVAEGWVRSRMEQAGISLSPGSLAAFESAPIGNRGER